MTTQPFKPDALELFTCWSNFLEWLLPTVEKFPKRVRFTFADRITQLALNIVEDIVEVRYASDKAFKQETLKRINLHLEKLRVLLRLSYKQHYLPHNSYEHAMRGINECGRMVGGWINWLKKQEQEAEQT